MLLMAIRKGSVEDIPAFEFIDKLCFPQSLRYSRFDFIYYFFKKNVVTFVIEEEKKVQGFIIADVKSPEVGHVISIDIHPFWRRSGLGSDLMAEVEGFFREMGIRKVILEVHESNVIAQMFYSNLGYRITQKLYNYYHSGHGMLMSKVIDTGKMPAIEQPNIEEMEVPVEEGRVQIVSGK